MADLRGVDFLKGLGQGVGRYWLLRTSGLSSLQSGQRDLNTIPEKQEACGLTLLTGGKDLCLCVHQFNSSRKECDAINWGSYKVSSMTESLYVCASHFRVLINIRK